jgi:putative hydrolase of the HAD superfamily
VHPSPGAILFDLDDTILDFEAVAGPAWETVTRRFASEYGDQPPERVRTRIGQVSRAWWSDPDRHRQGRLDLANTRRANVAEALRDLAIEDDGLAERLAVAFAERRTAAIRPFPGALETLAHFSDAGVPLALVTNGDAAGQRAKIERFDLSPFFDCIVVEEEFGVGKPDERVFRHALSALQADPEQTWMVGDNLWWEIEPCHRLGLHTIWVDVRGEGSPAESPVEPHRTVRAIAELLP